MMPPRAVFAPHELEAARLAARGLDAAAIAEALELRPAELGPTMHALDDARGRAAWRYVLGAATGWLERTGRPAANASWAAALDVAPGEILEHAARAVWREPGVLVALAPDKPVAVIGKRRDWAADGAACGALRRPLALALTAYGVLTPVREARSVTELAPRAGADTRGAGEAAGAPAGAPASGKRVLREKLAAFREAWAVSGVVEHFSVRETRRRLPLRTWLCLAAAADGERLRDIERRHALPARSGKAVVEIALDVWRRVEGERRAGAA